MTGVPNPHRKAVPDRVKAALAICALFIASPAFCYKRAGAGPNGWALAAVKTYCIDKSKLSGRDRRMVDNFVISESKPKHLLAKLHWKLIKSCSEDGVDAKVTLEFIHLRKIAISNKHTGGITPPDAPSAPIWLVLTVADNSNGYPLDRVHSAPIDVPAQTQSTPDKPPSPYVVKKKRDALYHAFWEVFADLKAFRVTPR